MISVLRGLRVVAERTSTRRVLFGSATLYLTLFLTALGNFSPGGRGFGIQTADWSRMFERVGPATFEPVVRITVPGLTVLLAPLNVLVASVLSALIGLGVARTWMAFREGEDGDVSPLLPGLPTVLAGTVLLAPGATIVFRIPVPASFVPIFRILIPAALILLVGALLGALRSVDSEGSAPGSSPPPTPGNAG